MSSQIYGHLCVWKSPSTPSFLATQIVYIGYGQLKKFDSFSFFLSIAVLLVFLYLIDSVMTVCYFYVLVPTTYHWKKLPSKYVVKNARSVTHFVWQTFFPLNFKGLSNKNIKYIHQNLRYYETIIQLLFCQEITYPCWWFIKINWSHWKT